MKSPKLEGDKLTFDVDVLEGDLAGADGGASVFMDLVNLPVPRIAVRIARAWYAGAGTLADSGLTLSCAMREARAAAHATPQPQSAHNPVRKWRRAEGAPVWQRFAPEESHHEPDIACILTGRRRWSSRRLQSSCKACRPAANPVRTPPTIFTPTTAPNWTPTAEGAIARQQIHDAGYSGVTMLVRNNDGSREGQTFKGDTYYLITLDPAGHVTQR